MHIMEGFLPPAHALGWSAASLPFVVWGLRSMQRSVKAQPEQRMLLGVSAAFAFLLSALKLPSVTGSCSHPTGVGLGAMLFGPAAMVPIALVVLLFQALLLAHGGLTTLGANLFSMGIVGPLVSYGVFRLARGCGLGRSGAVFTAACLAAPGCASWYQPPVEKPPGEYSIERMEDEHLQRLQRDLSLYSD